jgi:hypothetical protein
MWRVPLVDVVDVLGLATQPLAVAESDPRERYLGPTLSAGALHAVETAVVPLRGSQRVLLYEPRRGCLAELELERPELLRRFRRTVDDLVPHARGTAFVFLGDLARIEAVYDNPGTLLWRESGCLQQTLALVCRAEGLAYCPLGVHAQDVADALSLTGVRPVALGAAVVGTPRLTPEPGTPAVAGA